jgi:hypothetical protein
MVAPQVAHERAEGVRERASRLSAETIAMSPESQVKFSPK